MERRSSPSCGRGSRSARGGAGATGASREASAGGEAGLGVDVLQVPGALRDGVEEVERGRVPFPRSAGAGVERVGDELVG